MEGEITIRQVHSSIALTPGELVDLESDAPDLVAECDGGSEATVTRESYNAEHADDPVLMEVAVRWSPLSTANDAHFLIADVVGRTFKHCLVTKYEKPTFQWEELSRITKVPAFRAFDWLPSQDLVAVGQGDGETTILSLKSGLQVLSLPIKSQRQCSAVSFSAECLLATGLERVRNDFCLNIYDVNQRITNQPRHGFASRQSTEPVRKLATAEGITSIKFFPRQPNTLVAGVKGTCIRTYDLRDSGSSPSRQYQSTYVHNIAIDPTDENYFASAAPQKDTTVLVWDRRSTIRPTSKKASTPQDGPILKLDAPFVGNERADASIWSLRFLSAEPGCLGILTSNGNFRICRTKKDIVAEEKHMGKETVSEEESREYVQPIRLTNLIPAARPEIRRPSGQDRDELGPVVSFDFTNVLTPSQQPCAIYLRGNQDINIYEIGKPPSVLAVSCKSTLAISEPRHGEASSKVSSDNRSDIKSGLIFGQPHRTGAVSDTVVAIRKKYGMDPQKMEISKKLSMSDALLLSDVARHRCLEGYLFDFNKNMDILKDDSDLQGMWGWIRVAHEKSLNGNMVSEKVDFSYVGIHGLWHHNLGKSASAFDAYLLIVPGRIEARTQSHTPMDVSIEYAITKLAQSLRAPMNSMPQTSKRHLRILCLYSLGFGPNAEELQHTVEKLASSGQNAQASLIALIFNDHELAFKALQAGPRKDEDAYQGLSMALTAFCLIEEGNLRGDRRTQALQRVKQSLRDTKGPYAKAIALYITTSEWAEVLKADFLPLGFRVAIALLSLPDADLTSYLNRETQRTVVSGDLQGIVLTGLSSPAIDLFESYIERTSDLQTAVLALSFAVPRFVRDDRFNVWRQAYRSLLNKWKLYIERSRFDAQSTRLSTTYDGTKIIRPTPPQVTLRCNKCGDAVHRDLPPENQSVSTISITGSQSQSQSHNVLGDSRSGTVCSKCNAHLPRCVICELWLGVPDQRTRGAAVGRERKDPFAQHLELCMTSRVESFLKTVRAARKSLQIKPLVMPPPRGRGTREPLPRDVMISKKISYVLRHGAEKEGLRLDQNGYANCAELLNWRNLSSLKVTFRELESIVATNDKKRFQLIPVSSSDDDTDPSNYLIRASQGHSIPIDSAALLTPVLPTDPDFPSQVVHGTHMGAWKLIEKSGGLSKMGRQHVHFARGLGSTYKVKPSSKPSGRDGAGSEEQAQQSEEGAQEGVPEVEEEAESKKVISGMRKTAAIFVWVDVKRSIEVGGLRWWKSANEVILTEGDEHGMVPLEFVNRVVQKRKGVVYRNERIMETASSSKIPGTQEMKEVSE
ncbi:hypothetical protein MMC30_001371 [Trapelia coarctata]|nr:hypothetical protein [Trapelia coarctata]